MLYSTIRGKNPGFDCVSFAGSPTIGLRSGLGRRSTVRCLRLLMQRHLILSHFRAISHFTGQSAKRRSETLTQQHRTGRLCDTLCERHRLAVCLDQRLGKNCPFTVIKCVKLKMTGWRSPTARPFFCAFHGIYFLLCCQPFFVLNCVQLELN